MRCVKCPPVGALDGKRAIVTGASSGIGAATARALAAEGAAVAVGARRLDRLAELGSGLIALELDVTDPESAASFVASAVHRLGGLDILVNNAGLALGRDLFDESTEADEEVVLETNVHGLIRMTRLCLPHLADGGYIVNMGSIAGRQPYERAALYVTSKYAVRGFTYALREDLLGRPIHLTTVEPGLVETDFSRVRFRGDEEAAAKVYEGVEPVRPEDVAACVVFAVTRPPHVNIDEIVVKALAQSTPTRIVRDR
jgi:3-hydroxy acid dehydrogenase / malonic semialdehyde reductase